jgi:thiamine biosynthesis lipoprotein
MIEVRKRRLLWQVPFLVLLIVGTVLIIRQQQSMPYQTTEGMVFGTVYKTTYQFDRDLRQEIEAELAHVDAEFSMFNDTSVVTRFNQGGRPVLDDTFKEVFQLASDISRQTDGAFDVTVAPLVNAWGFGFKHEQMPTRQQVDSLRKFVGMQHLTYDKRRSLITKDDPRVMLDFSAIAKGYGSDVVARLLRRYGIQNFLVEIGGEMVVSGISPKRLPWRVGVAKPTDDSLAVSGQMQTVLNVTDCAMATSGNYRRFYYKGGRKYAHTIDPKTGYPVQHSLLSATVLAKDCAVADAYATSLMVMGLDKARKLLEQHPELMAYLIYSDQNGELATWFSPSLRDKIAE